MEFIPTISIIGGVFTNTEPLKIGFVFGIIILLLGVSVIPSIGISNNDDTTPPVTTHSLDPLEPDGLNGWYVSDVNVTLTATDDISGVNVTYYSIDGGEWEIYNESFILSEDGNDILIEYYSVDNAGNKEDVKSFIIDIDQTEPEICLTYEVNGGHPILGWWFTFIATTEDVISGMDRVEFYINDFYQETVTSTGPDYFWEVLLPGLLENTFNVRGLIYDLEINDDSVKFKTLIVRISRYYYYDLVNLRPKACGFDKAGNWDYDEIYSAGNSISITHGIYIFKSIVLPNNYVGHIGDNFIFATFNIN